MTDEQDELIQHLKGVREIVINKCYGGFSLSHKAELLYLKLAMIDYTTTDRISRDETERFGSLILIDDVEWSGKEISRDDPVLVAVVKRLGNSSWGKYSELKIVKIPADVQWQVDSYDGREWVAEAHRRWT